MLRQSTLAAGLLLLVGLVAPAAPAQEPAAHGTPAAHPAPAASAPMTPGQKQEDAVEKAVEAGQPGHEGADLNHGKSPDIMQIQPPLAIYTVIVFGLVLLILGRFAWRPILRAMHEREAHLEQVLLDSERARNEAEAIAAGHRKQLAGAADEVRALIDQARKDAQASADAIVRKAQAEAEASRDRAEREISGLRDQVLLDIKSQTADLVVSVAGRVLERELGESDHRRLVDAALGELPRNGQQGGRA